MTQRREDINSTMFTKGDIAIAIEWFEWTTEDYDGLTFEQGVNMEGATQDIINSTELRAASSTPFDNGLHFTMEPVVETTISPAFRPADAVRDAIRPRRGGGGGGNSVAASRRHSVRGARQGGRGDPPVLLAGWTAHVVMCSALGTRLALLYACLG